MRCPAWPTKFGFFRRRYAFSLGVSPAAMPNASTNPTRTGSHFYLTFATYPVMIYLPLYGVLNVLRLTTGRPQTPLPQLRVCGLCTVLPVHPRLHAARTPSDAQVLSSVRPGREAIRASSRCKTIEPTVRHATPSPLFQGPRLRPQPV